jgi:hypothetical protein
MNIKGTSLSKPIDLHCTSKFYQWLRTQVGPLQITPSIPQYKMFWQAKTACQNKIYCGTEGVRLNDKDQ